MRCLLVENYHQFPSALNFGSLPQFFAPFRGQQNSKTKGKDGDDAFCVRVSSPPRLIRAWQGIISADPTVRSPKEAVATSSLHITPCSPLVFACTYKDRRTRLLLHFTLPGWRWGTLPQIPLVAVSRPLHSGVCETRQDAGLPVIHSAISDSGRLRTRGGQPSTLIQLVKQ